MIEKMKAIRLVLAIEAFSEGTALILAGELRSFLENDSIAVMRTDLVAGPTELASLRAEVLRLTSELAKAHEAAGTRTTADAIQ